MYEHADEFINKMDAILASIKPQWLDLILSGQKTIELRKSSPLHPVSQIYWHRSGGQGIHAVSNITEITKLALHQLSARELERLSKESCVPAGEIMAYTALGQLHLWHITNSQPLQIPIPDGGGVPQSWRYLYKEASK